MASFNSTTLINGAPLSINSTKDARIPDVVRLKYARAQKLYLLGWIDADLIKAGELVALTALELALMDRYGTKLKTRERTFAAVLRHLVEVDGLTDAQIPMVARCGGSAIGQLIGTHRPTLAQRRNEMVVEFTVLARSFVGLNGGPNFKAN